MFRLALCFILVFLLFPMPATAADTIRVQPVSGRYSLEVPANWVVTTEEVRGLSGTFRGEIIAVADSEAAMRSLQANNRTLAVSGQTLIANVFPTATATFGQVVDDPNEVFRMILREDAATAEFLEIGGLAAVRVDNYPGPPYENAAFAGLTMILDHELIYYVVYSGPDTTSLEQLARIVETLTVHPNASALFGERPPFVVNQLEIPLLGDWLVLASGPSGGGVEYYMIVADPNQTLGYAVGFGAGPDLPGLFIQVQVQPYDFLYSTIDYEPTDDDRAFILGQALANTGGEPQLGIETLTIDSKVALRLELDSAFGGANHGVILLIDSGQAMYSLTVVAPAAEWETTYLPLINDWFEALALAEYTIGVQIGQLAPDFSLALLDGSNVRLTDLQGQIVLINFWATWCEPCRSEMPALQSLYANGDQDFVIIAVNLMESIDVVQPFVDELGLTFPIALDFNGDVNRLFNIIGYPTTYIVNAEGVIEIAHTGPVTSVQVEQWLEMARD